MNAYLNSWLSCIYLTANCGENFLNLPLILKDKMVIKQYMTWLELVEYCDITNLLFSAAI